MLAAILTPLLGGHAVRQEQWIEVTIETEGVGLPLIGERLVVAQEVTEVVPALVALGLVRVVARAGTVRLALGPRRGDAETHGIRLPCALFGTEADGVEGAGVVRPRRDVLHLRGVEGSLHHRRHADVLGEVRALDVEDALIALLGALNRNLGSHRARRVAVAFELAEAAFHLEHHCRVLFEVRDQALGHRTGATGRGRNHRRSASSGRHAATRTAHGRGSAVADRRRTRSSAADGRIATTGIGSTGSAGRSAATGSGSSRATRTALG